jgi:hypothetical protein
MFIFEEKSYKSAYDCFLYLCYFGYLEQAQKLYSIEHDNIDIHNNNEFVFVSSCTRRCLNIVQWLYNLYLVDDLCTISKMELYFGYYFNVFLEKIIEEYELENIEEAKKIYNENDFDIYPFNKKFEVFKHACFSGNFELAKWIYSLNGKFNIHVNNDLIFRATCSKGHIEIVKWLYSLDNKFNVHAENDFAFRNACFLGYIEVAKFLYSLEDKPSKDVIDHIIETVRFFPDYDNITNWLLSLYNKNPKKRYRIS